MFDVMSIWMGKVFRVALSGIEEHPMAKQIGVRKCSVQHHL
jgi:hypothetical protein